MLVPTIARAHGPDEHDEPVKSVDVVDNDVVDNAVESSSNAAQNAVDAATADPSFSLITLLEQLHPVTVHFPIALFVTAALVDLVEWRRPSPALRSAVSIMVLVGAIGAVIAAAFGWIHTGMWVGGEAMMQRHRWAGTALAIASVPLAWIFVRSGEARRPWHRAALCVMAVAIMVQAYWGAELGHGPNHLFAPSH